MKTIKLNDKILRVTDKEAQIKIDEFDWKYIPKSEWKKTRPEKVEKRKKVNKKTKKKSKKDE